MSTFLCRRCRTKKPSSEAHRGVDLIGPFCGKECADAAEVARVLALAADSPSAAPAIKWRDERGRVIANSFPDAPREVRSTVGTLRGHTTPRRIQDLSVVRDGDMVCIDERGLAFRAPPAGSSVLVRARINSPDPWDIPDPTPNLTAVWTATCTIVEAISTVHATAHRFWRTDPDVIAAVEDVADHVIGGRVSHGRLGRAYVLAWRNDFLGLRSRWVQRAYRAEGWVL